MQKNTLQTLIVLDPDLNQAGEVARAFAKAIGRDWGAATLAKIDELNAAEANPGICHSGDFCDSNVYMEEAIGEVTKLEVNPLAEDGKAFKLWNTAWDYAKAVGFRKLGAVFGDPDCPPDPLGVINPPERPHSLVVSLPGLPEPKNYPLEVELDWWGRNPHLQVLCREHDDPEGEPVVVVRYGSDGKVVEVIVGKTTLVRDHTGDFVESPTYVETPWEIEQDSNPVCEDGDLLQCPSGQVGRVMRLRDRYDGSFEQFESYAETYGLMERLGVYTDTAQAWDVNPLTVGTTDPDDFSRVPEKPTPEKIEN